MPPTTCGANFSICVFVDRFTFRPVGHHELDARIRNYRVGKPAPRHRRPSGGDRDYTAITSSGDSIWHPASYRRSSISSWENIRQGVALGTLVGHWAVDRAALLAFPRHPDRSDVRTLAHERGSDRSEGRQCQPSSSSQDLKPTQFLRPSEYAAEKRGQSPIPTPMIQVASPGPGSDSGARARRVASSAWMPSHAGFRRRAAWTPRTESITTDRRGRGPSLRARLKMAGSGLPDHASGDVGTGNQRSIRVLSIEPDIGSGAAVAMAIGL